ncbi:nicotinate-nucleotide adenylyltransferase [Algibacter sp.]|uniref:nicotinate-nucleotide adenylyltransferase n=1 Tax=Algibacter sp. TaxID=1872428 RepID=UPI003C7744AE
MKKLVLGLFIFGLTIQINAQTVELPETIISVNYKYLATVDTDNVPERVKKLEEVMLNYKNIEQSELYDDEHDIYSVSFYVPEGKIVAAYDKNGKIVRTIEKYKNIRLPLEVLQAVSKRFPNWGIVEDVYFINYNIDSDSLKQAYKIKLQNKDEIITIKTDEKGAFI